MVDNFDWLLKLLPEGASTTAVIVSVVLFLKHLATQDEEHRAVIKEITDNFIMSQQSERAIYSTEVREARKAYAEQLALVSDVTTRAHESLRARVEAMSELSVKTSADNVLALAALRDAISQLKEKVK